MIPATIPAKVSVDYVVTDGKGQTVWATSQTATTRQIKLNEECHETNQAPKWEQFRVTKTEIWERIP